MRDTVDVVKDWRADKGYIVQIHAKTLQKCRGTEIEKNLLSLFAVFVKEGWKRGTMFAGWRGSCIVLIVLMLRGM